MTLQEIFSNWDSVPVEVKKEIFNKREAAIQKYQGSVTITASGKTAAAE